MKTQNENISKEIGAICGSGFIGDEILQNENIPKAIDVIAYPFPIFMFAPMFAPIIIFMFASIIIFSLVISYFYDKIKFFLKNAKTKIKTCFIRCKG